MKWMVCAFGNPEEHAYIPLVEQFGFGIELQSYGLKGALSEEAWNRRRELHRKVVAQFKGPLAIHGPFLGIAFNYKDHLLKKAVRDRMDMLYEVVSEFKPQTLVMHPGLNSEVTIFKFEDEYIRDVSGFWKEEIKRYEELGVTVVLENIIDANPELLIRLTDAIDHPNCRICLDTGHLNIVSKLSLRDWVYAAGDRLHHVHLHDNHGSHDEHLPIGKGLIDFDSFFDALKKMAPHVTVSLEIDANPLEVIESVKLVISKYGDSAL